MEFIKPGVKFTDVHQVCMRVLAEGRQNTTRLISVLLGGGGLVIVIGLAWLAVDAIL